MTKSSAGGGLFLALKGIPGTLLGIVQTRLELLANEFEMQKLTLLRTLLTQAVMFCAAVGLVLLVVLLALLMWDQRVIVVAVCTAVFLLAAAWFYRALMRIVNAPEPAFAATLAELQEDMRQLRTATNHANAAD